VPFNQLARHCVRRGIEAQEDFLVGVPVLVEGVQMPFEFFVVESSGRSCQDL